VATTVPTPRRLSPRDQREMHAAHWDLWASIDELCEGEAFQRLVADERDDRDENDEESESDIAARRIEAASAAARFRARARFGRSRSGLLRGHAASATQPSPPEVPNVA